jgi:hypothetical protein
MKTRFWIPVLPFLFVSILNAAETGTVSGNVVDDHTRQPLFGANVVVMDTDRGATTDAEGNYTIENLPVGTYRIRISFIGYKPQVKTDVVVISAGPVFSNARLEPETLQARAVRVRAGYFSSEIETHPSTVALSREEIRRFPGGYEDVVRTVSTLPGVAVNMEGGRNDILVRGGGPSENLYRVNGIEVPNINHFGTPGNSGGSLSFVNLDFVEDVSFSTGGFGAQYGDKMSSVVDLTLVKRKPGRFGAKATVSATQYGLNVEAPVKNKGSVLLSARKSYLDLIFRAAGLPFIPVYTDYNVLMNVDLTPRDRLFFLGLSAIDLVDRDQSSLENRVFNAGILDNTQYKGITGIDYRRLLSNGYLEATLSVDLARYRLSQIDGNEREYFRSHADEWEYAASVKHSIRLKPSLLLNTGVSAKAVRNVNRTVFADTIYDRSGNRIPVSALGVPADTRLDAVRGKWAGYAEFEWDPLPRLQVTGGWREDYFDFIDRPWAGSPRAALKFRAAERHTLRLAGGGYLQSPSYVWVANPANRSLRPLKNRMAVAGWDFLPRDDTRATIEIYTKRYSDLPAGILPGVNDYLVMSNTGASFGGREDDFQSFGFFKLASSGRGRSDGAELSVQKKFSGLPLYGLFSLAYNKCEVTAPNGKTYPGQFDQRWIANLSGGYVFNAKWEVSAKFKYFTGVPYTPVYRPSANPLRPGEIQNLPDEYLSARLGPGHQLDVRADRTFNFPGLTMIVYADIQNVYNFKYPMKPQYDFWKDKVLTQGDIGILPSIGISLQL